VVADCATAARQEQSARAATMHANPVKGDKFFTVGLRIDV
jgi:hypothetical protein